MSAARFIQNFYFKISSTFLGNLAAESSKLASINFCCLYRVKNEPGEIASKPQKNIFIVIPEFIKKNN